MADVIIVNADVVTMDLRMPAASAVAIRDGKIIAVGDRSLVLDFRQPHTRVLDVEGKTLLPGFIDAHLHFRALAESLVDVDLGSDSGIDDIPGIQRQIRLETLKIPPGKWIRGVGYHEAGLKEQRPPDRYDLDQVSPRHPVKLTHRSGYAHVLNSPGLKISGISRETPDPDGGIIERDLKTGEPTGVLFGMGNYLNEKIPPIEGDALSKGVRRANRNLISCGITAFQDVSSRNDADRVKWFQYLKQIGALSPHLTVALGFESFRKGLEDDPSTRIHEPDVLSSGYESRPTISESAGIREPDVLSSGYESRPTISESAGIREPDVRIAGVKIIVDETTGRLNPDPETLGGMVRLVHNAGEQAVIHAVEDSAVDAAVTAIEQALAQNPRPDHRHRIEHCSICPPDLIRRIAAAKIFVVTHPGFVHHNGDRYLKTVSPEQMPYLYPIASLLKAGVQVAAGSDAPMIQADPLAAIFGAVTRLTRTGKMVLETEKITSEEALRMFTESAARMDFEEEGRGTISTGKSADFVVLSANPLKVASNGIRNIAVEKTIIDGKVIWEREGHESI